MALIQNNTGNGSNSINYKLQKMPDGSRAFTTECAAGTPGAVEMRHPNDSPKGKFAAGDSYFVIAGNTLRGKLGGMWLKSGYSKNDGGHDVSREVSIMLVSHNEDGVRVAEFLQLPFLDKDGRVDSTTAKLLSRLKKANLDEDVSISVYSFAHKAGDKMYSKNADENGPVWQKDGVSVVLTPYQDSLKSADNEKGAIKIEASEYYRQPVRYPLGDSLVPVNPGEKAPDGVVLNYNYDDAIAFAKSVAAAISPATAENSEPTETAEAPAAA